MGIPTIYSPKNPMGQMLLSLPPMRMGEIHSRHCRNRDLRDFTPQWRAGSHFCHDPPGAAGCRGVHEPHPRGVEGLVPQAPQEFVGELLGGVVQDQPRRLTQDVEEKQRCCPFLGEKGNSEVRGSQGVVVWGWCCRIQFLCFSDQSAVV